MEKYPEMGSIIDQLNLWIRAWCLGVYIFILGLEVIINYSQRPEQRRRSEASGSLLWFVLAQSVGWAPPVPPVESL